MWRSEVVELASNLLMKARMSRWSSRASAGSGTGQIIAPCPEEGGHMICVSGELRETCPGDRGLRRGRAGGSPEPEPWHWKIRGEGN